jgi:hypothetical protein
MAAIVKKLKTTVRDPELAWDYLRARFGKKHQPKLEYDPAQYKAGIKVKIDPLKISKNIVTFRWDSDGKIPGVLKDEWSITYPSDVDLTAVPRELLWMMYALMTSEFFAWTSKINVVLPEKLDERFLKWWKGVLEINHKANHYKKNLSADSNFSFVNGKSEAGYSPNRRQTWLGIACMNGMGKDALTQMAVVKELTQEPILAVTVENPWQFPKIRIFKKLREACKTLEQYDIHPLVISSSINQSFEFKIIPWYIFSLPLLYVYNVRMCYHAEELDYNKYFNGVPIKPNTSVTLLEAINKLMRDLDYEIEFRSGIVPLSSFGTQKLLIERYPEFQKLQFSCTNRYPPCSRCMKCQSRMAYIAICGKDYRDFGYRDVKLMSASEITPVEFLDIVRESEHHAFNKASGVRDELDWVEKYYKDALPYTAPGIEKILKEHFDAFEGPFTSYGIYKYDVREWDKTIKNIYKSCGRR